MKNLTMQQLRFKPNWGKSAYALLFLFLTTAIALPAQTFTTLLDFEPTTGASPYLVSLVQGTDGNYYGTTEVGGSGDNPSGTVFRITPAGVLTTLHTFTGDDGSYPYAGALVQAPNGNLYGTTLENGAGGYGTVFEITLGGTLTTLHSFDFTDGASPTGLVLASNGDFYGVTRNGGSGGNYGTVFKITPSGTLTTLHIFEGYSAGDGAYPYGALVQATNGDLYGTTFAGGAPNVGTVFKITPAGALTTIFAFPTDGGDGANPYGALVQASNGDLYGTTSVDGAGGTNSDGTVFKITPGGTLTTLHSFDFTDGSNPYAGLVQGIDGNFYGTTNEGGANSVGTIFKITPGGTLTTLHSFDGTDGRNPTGGLIQATSGTFYGTTWLGGDLTCGPPTGCGTVFSLAVGLGPFVETVPPSGPVGRVVLILGTDLTGATAVTFNGMAARFTVVSPSEIKTSVPAGATTGKVKVITPSGTLSSNLSFQVLP